MLAHSSLYRRLGYDLLRGLWNARAGITSDVNLDPHSKRPMNLPSVPDLPSFCFSSSSRSELEEDNVRACVRLNYDTTGDIITKHIKIKKVLQELGFILKQGNDPNHWTYVHPELRNDPIFRNPCNLYRPHGKGRSCARIGRHDQSMAKQRIEVLRAIRGASDNDAED